MKTIAYWSRALASLVVMATAGMLFAGACGGSARGDSDSPIGVEGPPAPTPTPTVPVPTTPGAPSAPLDDPGPPAVRFIGRFDVRDPEGPICGWPGCRIRANFDGTSVSIRMNEQQMPDGPSEWDVVVDGKLQPKLVMELGDHTYQLANDLEAGHHSVEVYKRTESQTGVTQFLGYDFHGGILLPPPLSAKRRIEIVGDSDVAGYGYEGALTGTDCGGEAWRAPYQNFHAAWGALLAEKLSADLDGTVFSGKGFYYNAWRPDLETIDVLYPRANPEDPTSTFDLKTKVPHVVIVAIGGNDFNLGEPTDTGPAPLEGFADKVRTFIAMLRTNYPEAHIFLMAYAVLTDDDPPGRFKRTNVVTALTTVATERQRAGDARVYFSAPPQANYTELTACDGHGGPEYHQRISTFMASEVSSRTGWN